MSANVLNVSQAIIQFQDHSLEAARRNEDWHPGTLQMA